jgi:hypothetical protein
MTTVSILLQIATTDPNASGKATIFWIFVILCVALFFFFLWRTNKIFDAKNANENKVQPVEVSKSKQVDVHEEEAAAIALAIHMYNKDLHDKENLTITLQKVSRIYSPWSSKIYTLTQNPRR